MGQETASPYSAPNGATYSGSAGEKELGIVSFKGLEHFSSFCCRWEGPHHFLFDILVPFNPKSVVKQIKE